MPKVRVFDSVDADPCPKCGVSAWIVDGDGEGHYWLLCQGVKDPGCIETMPLPSGYVVEGDAA